MFLSADTFPTVITGLSLSLHCLCSMERVHLAPQFDLQAQIWLEILCCMFSLQLPLILFVLDQSSATEENSSSGAYFHVMSMNFNDHDGAATEKRLHKKGSLRSRPRLCCCQDLSHHPPYTILLQLACCRDNPPPQKSLGLLGLLAKSTAPGNTFECGLTAKIHHQGASYSLCFSESSAKN